MSLSSKSKVSKKAVKDDDGEEVMEAQEVNEEEVAGAPEEDEDSVGNSQVQKPAIEMKVPLSQALLTKLKKSAEEEGISPTELAVELITEGLVLRVWEILERNQNIRGSSHPNQGHQQGGGGGQNHRQNNQRNFNNNNNNRHRNNRQQNNMNIMQDKAAFLEYVRNQERKRR